MRVLSVTARPRVNVSDTVSIKRNENQTTSAGISGETRGRGDRVPSRRVLRSEKQRSLYPRAPARHDLSAHRVIFFVEKPIRTPHFGSGFTPFALSRLVINEFPASIAIRLPYRAGNASSRAVTATRTIFVRPSCHVSCLISARLFTKDRKISM